MSYGNKKALQEPTMSKKKKKEEEPKSSLKFFLLASIVLFVFLAISIYHNSKNPFTQVLQEYVVNKQEIHDFLGLVDKVSGMPTTQVVDRNTKQNVSVKLIGKTGSGTLDAVMEHSLNGWRLSKATLRIGNTLHRLSPMYVRDISYNEASATADTANKPVFEAGNDIIIKTLLKGIPTNNNSLRITQNLSVFDVHRKLLKQKNNVASFESSPKQKAGSSSQNEQTAITAQNVTNDELTFTTKISNLSPGTYYLNMSFQDNDSALTENHWRKIIINDPKDKVAVLSILFFKDQNLTEPKTDAVFTTSEDIFIRLNLAGFMVSGQSIAGTVDLKIENSHGGLVAYKPGFVTFKQPYDQKKQVVVDGHLRLTEPDVYFLSFRIQDEHAHTQVIRNAKIVVRFPDFEKPATPEPVASPPTKD